MLQFLETTTGLTGRGGTTSTIIMLVVMLGVFYFLMIRPENKRKKEAEQLRSNLSVGDRVTTIGGITGTIVNIKEDKFVLETSADQVRIEMLKWAISTNDSAEERVKAERARFEEEKAKAKAAKKAKRKKED